MTSYPVTIDETVAGGDGNVLYATLRSALVQGALLRPTDGETFGFPRTLSQSLHVSRSDVEAWRWGPTLSQSLGVHLTSAVQAKYSVLDHEVVKLAQALIRAFPAALSQSLTVHQAQTLAVGLRLLQALKLTPADAPHAHYNLGLVQALALNAAFMRFVAASLVQNLQVHAAPIVQTLRNVQLAQNLTLHGALKNTLAISLTGALGLGEIDVLKAIYRGDALLDTINLGALYVDANGTVATFAINTRTNAITEYQNYAFNSFASMGLRYIAASADGVFELDGELDDGALIPAELETGYYQMAGTKTAGIKGCYLAMRGQGQALLKIIAGDGREYVYRANVQPGLMNTKINIGKGLFARYFAFNLQTPGQDWDLDDVEFVPMMRDRRV